MYKFDKEKMREAMELYLQNDGWKEMYENAPSDVCKKFFRMTFYKSMHGEPSGERYAEVKEKVYASLGIADWEYLKNCFGNSPFRKVCSDKIKELQGQQ